MSEENMLIIKQINKFGRVLRTPELLKMIEDLEEQRKKLQEELEYTIGIVEHNRIISEKNKEIHQQ